jgi:MOSC domain-containing protein YiiM/ferredoxin
MRLVSINVARPRTVRWRGQDVRTSIYKQPIEGRRMARRLNLDGDGQADLRAHGGEHRAVYVYQRESYRHWERELGRTFDGFGRFGENFTVEGLADEEVCIGDRYRIGGAVFEVTQPRVTCFKVGMVTEEPRMPALLVGHGRPGFYLRVITEGEVGPGDAIELVEPGPGMSVRDISALLYLPVDRSAATLRRAIAIPALSEGWRGSFQAMLDRDETATGNAGLGKATAPPAWEGFRRFRVAEVRPESRAVTSFVLCPEDGEPLAPFSAGQSLTLRLHPHRDDRVVLRSYSLSDAADPARMRISVKREPHGVVSRYLHTSVRAGDVLEVGAGVAAERLHSESFGPALTSGPRTAPHPPAGASGDGPLVSFARSGLTVAWAPRFGTLLELAEACDVPADWSCRTGVCHRCEVGLVDGEVGYEPEPLEPPAEGGVLVCCSAPRRDVVLDL